MDTYNVYTLYLLLENPRELFTKQTGKQKAQRIAWVTTVKCIDCHDTSVTGAWAEMGVLKAVIRLAKASIVSLTFKVKEHVG